MGRGGLNYSVSNVSRQDASAVLEQCVLQLVAVAAGPADQIAFLRRWGFQDNADALALDLDNWIGAAWVLREHSLISQELYEALWELDRFLRNMSVAAHADLWTFSSLRSAGEWVSVREMAAAILNQLRASGQRIPSIEEVISRVTRGDGWKASGETSTFVGEVSGRIRSDSGTGHYARPPWTGQALQTALACL